MVQTSGNALVDNAYRLMLFATRCTTAMTRLMKCCAQVRWLTMQCQTDAHSYEVCMAFDAVVMVHPCDDLSDTVYCGTLAAL